MAKPVTEKIGEQIKKTGRTQPSFYKYSFKYILTVIEVFSKYACAISIKDKSAASVTKAFEKIISDRIPKKLWVDEGKEFYNATFKKLLDKHKIVINTLKERNI